MAIDFGILLDFHLPLTFLFQILFLFFNYLPSIFLLLLLPLSLTLLGPGSALAGCLLVLWLGGLLERRGGIAYDIPLLIRQRVLRKLLLRSDYKLLGLRNRGHGAARSTIGNEYLLHRVLRLWVLGQGFVIGEEELLGLGCEGQGLPRHQTHRNLHKILARRPRMTVGPRA